MIINSKSILILIVIIFNVCLINSEKCNVNKKKPNIVIIMADDMGYNDVSYNGMNQFLTPNIDALALNGIVMHNYYTLPMCTPSRTALMTGRYAIRTGMQNYVIANDQPWGLCPKEKIMPQIFREAGYSTNLVGKWHLGFFKKAYTPTFRGFDNHYGYMGGYIDYWDQMLDRGRDFYRNGVSTSEGNGSYTTTLLTNEAVRVIKNHNDKSKKSLFLMVNHLAPHAGNDDDPYQAPEEDVNKFNYIIDENRRKYAAMMTKLDESVGTIMDALQKQNMLCNSIVIFYSDNGAPTVGLHSNSGSNKPFKGQKNSPWEGAVRVPGIIYSPLLKKQKYIFKQRIHVTDLLPTLAAVSGINLNTKTDGINIWPLLNSGHIVKRKILNNLDDVFGYASYMDGSWKYVNGTTENGKFDKYLGNIGDERDPRSFNYAQTILESKVQKVLTRQSYCKSDPLTRRNIRQFRKVIKVNCPTYKIFDQNPSLICKPLQAPCLFNLNIDPCERYNFAGLEPVRLKSMEDVIKTFRQQQIKPVNQKSDPLSAPELHDFKWTWWKDDSSIGMPGTYCI